MGRHWVSYYRIVRNSPLPHCGHPWATDDLNYNSEACDDCELMWAEGLVPDDTETPKGKAVARLIARIRYPKPHKCSIDGCKNRGERHHLDYNKPTEIIWLCLEHHHKLHRMLRRIKK